MLKKKTREYRVVEGVGLHLDCTIRAVKIIVLEGHQKHGVRVGAKRGCGIRLPVDAGGLLTLAADSTDRRLKAKERVNYSSTFFRTEC